MWVIIPDEMVAYVKYKGTLLLSVQVSLVSLAKVGWFVLPAYRFLTGKKSPILNINWGEGQGVFYCDVQKSDFVLSPAFAYVKKLPAAAQSSRLKPLYPLL